jgi:hypothetical protein
MRLNISAATIAFISVFCMAQTRDSGTAAYTVSPALLSETEVSVFASAEARRSATVEDSSDTRRAAAESAAGSRLTCCKTCM